ncbi:hypothetical protein HPB48_017742 [Haemaphysalis longicornis]|uniref:Uncharacterized protein n=1 Tax=Haemaphysalis longicornis TaxID=44386 RepID=A0A9J6G349_HAELO|nr:hypothetical protein HPB48_017742 [Haemaphysalis longicornis]
MPPKAPDELLTMQFARFGRVLRVVREGWRRSGLGHMTNTTRVVHIIPREPNSLDAVPHQALINGDPILMDVTGRPPMCLRCRDQPHPKASARHRGTAPAVRSGIRRQTARSRTQPGLGNQRQRNP